MGSRKGLWGRILLVAVLVMAVVLFFALDLGRFLNLAQIKASQDQLHALVRDHFWAMITGYMAIYILVTTLSLPGAAVMTLAGGALFGLVPGTLAVSFASSIGATLACAVSRYLLRDWVQTKFGDRLAPINRGMAEEGGFYLFSLRLVPVFPFFVINLVMGLTPIPLPTFYWVSQLGMLPATVVYVNAGTQLARIDSLSGILSVPLVVSFALLGLFPVVSKKGMQWLAARRKQSLKKKQNPTSGD